MQRLLLASVDAGHELQLSDTNLKTHAICTTALRHGLLSYLFGSGRLRHLHQPRRQHRQQQRRRLDRPPAGRGVAAAVAHAETAPSVGWPSGGRGLGGRRLLVSGVSDLGVDEDGGAGAAGVDGWGAARLSWVLLTAVGRFS